MPPHFMNFNSVPYLSKIHVMFSSVSDSISPTAFLSKEAHFSKCFLETFSHSPFWALKV